MPANDSAALIVARFLKANNYAESYEAFIKEAGLPDDAGEVSTTAELTLERLLEEKRLFDQSVNFEKLNLADDQDQGWSSLAPSSATVISSLPSRSNLLHVLINNDHDLSQIIATTSDRRINVVDLPSLTLKSSWSDVQDAPVLSQLIIRGLYHVSSSMSGSLVLADLKSGKVIEKRRDHAKYIVSLAGFDAGEVTLLASAGWDSFIHIYALNLTAGNRMLSEPLAKIQLQTNPESITFTTHPETQVPLLVVTRKSSSHLYFYSADKDARLLGKQNLAPHSNAWVAFTPVSVALCPTDSSTVAVATDSTPHMKLLVVKLLIPNDGQSDDVPQTAREQALTQQTIAGREHAAIKLHCNTMSAQTPYSSPLVVWRPHGKGVWVNSDDGTIRGIDVVSGKVVSELKGHTPGTKVRTMWTSDVLEDGETSETLVSGGFDQQLILWKTVPDT